MSRHGKVSGGGGRRGRLGVGLLGDDLAAQFDAFVADRNLWRGASHNRGDLIAGLAAERAADAVQRSASRRFRTHIENATRGTVRP